MIGAIIAIYIVGLITQLFIFFFCMDSGDDADGWLFAILIWPIDWIRRFYRSFKRWLNR